MDIYIRICQGIKNCNLDIIFYVRYIINPFYKQYCTHTNSGEDLEITLKFYCQISWT